MTGFSDPQAEHAVPPAAHPQISPGPVEERVAGLEVSTRQLYNTVSSLSNTVERQNTNTERQISDLAHSVSEGFTQVRTMQAEASIQTQKAISESNDRFQRALTDNTRPPLQLLFTVATAVVVGLVTVSGYQIGPTQVGLEHHKENTALMRQDFKERMDDLDSKSEWRHEEQGKRLTGLTTELDEEIERTYNRIRDLIASNKELWDSKTGDHNRRLEILEGSFKELAGTEETLVALNERLTALKDDLEEHASQSDHPWGLLTKISALESSMAALGQQHIEHENLLREAANYKLTKQQVIVNTEEIKRIRDRYERLMDEREVRNE